MVKRAKEAAEPARKRHSLVNSPSRGLRGAPVDTAHLIESTVLECSDQPFNSEQQAIDFLVGSLVEKLGDKPQERAELTDFLNLLIETDPALREEILSGVSIKNS